MALSWRFIAWARLKAMFPSSSLARIWSTVARGSFDGGVPPPDGCDPPFPAAGDDGATLAAGGNRPPNLGTVGGGASLTVEVDRPPFLAACRGGTSLAAGIGHPISTTLIRVAAPLLRPKAYFPQGFAPPYTEICTIHGRSL